MNFFESLKSRVINLFKKSDLKNIAGEIRVSDKMAEAVNEWLCLFYSKEGVGFAKVLTSYMATLTVNELAVSAGTGKRAEFIEGEIEKYLIPNIRTAVQLAGAGEK